MKCMIIPLLVLLSTIYTKNSLYNPLRICLNKLIPEIQEVSPEEYKGVTSDHVIKAKLGDQAFTVKVYRDPNWKYARDNAEHDIFKAFQAKKGYYTDSKKYENLLQTVNKPDIFHMKCTDYTGYDINVQKYVASISEVKSSYNLMENEIDAACQFYDLATRLSELHGIGFYHNNINPESVGYDENGRLTFRDYGKASKIFIFNKSQNAIYHKSDYKSLANNQQKNSTSKIESYQLAMTLFYLRNNYKYNDKSRTYTGTRLSFRPIDCFEGILTDYIKEDIISCLKSNFFSKIAPERKCEATHNRLKHIYQDVVGQISQEMVPSVKNSNSEPHMNEPNLSKFLPDEFTKDNKYYHDEQEARMDIDEFDGGTNYNCN